MGLFDRLKKAFHKEKEQHEENKDVELVDSEEQSEELENQKSIQDEIESEIEAENSTDKLKVDAEKEEDSISESNEPEGISDDTVKVEAADEIQSDSEDESNEDELSEHDESESASVDIEDSEGLDEDESETAEQTEKLDHAIKIKTIDDNDTIETDERYDKGLEKTRQTFGEKMNALFANFRRVDEDFFEELEDTLITSDVGFETAMKLTDELREEVKLKKAKKVSDIQNVIIEKLVDLYDQQGESEDNAIHLKKDGLSIILFVGVNGAGKTTTIGKLAHQFHEQGKKVILAAADTFRAGAIDQLVVWGERTGVEVVRGKEGGDPASVVFDAVKKAKEENADILLVDTAGRLQNKVNLMNELEKIKRILQREEPDAPQEVLLVLDATTGQNAMSQAKQFKETTDVTGLVLTKLDGTAKGGMILAIRNELHIPVKLVGLGEGINDLATFDPEKFAYGLFKGLWKEK